MRVGIDTYSYHRFFGEIREGEWDPGTRWTTWDFLDRAVELEVDGVSLETCYLDLDDAEFRERLALSLDEAGLNRALAWGDIPGVCRWANPPRGSTTCSVSLTMPQPWVYLWYGWWSAPSPIGARSRPMSRWKDFCASNEHLWEILDILGEFGAGGRYDNLDVLMDSRSQADHPMERWKALEKSVHDEDPNWLQLMQSDTRLWSQRWYPYLAARQVEAVQRVARFLVRLWTLGPARAQGKRLSGLLGRFLFITDEQLRSSPTGLLLTARLVILPADSEAAVGPVRSLSRLVRYE